MVHDGTLKHTHPPITPEIKAKEAVDRIQRRAQDHPNEPPQQVIAPELRNEHNEEVLAHLPEHQNLRRSINRMQNWSRPNNPADLNSLNIVEPYTTTIKGQRFLQCDSGPYNEKRLIIFTTKESLRILCESPMIFSNGTFKTAPHMFTQLFTVHGLYLKHLFPLVYALTTHKDKETYDLEEIKSLTTQNGYTFRPETMMSDFELASMNAARAHVVGIRINGCLFHLSQSTWRHVEENGLATAYTNDEEVRAQIQHLGLPLVPLEDISEVFEDISQDDLSAQVAAVYETFEVTYVHGRPCLLYTSPSPRD